jgi:hypothetical protein
MMRLTNLDCNILHELCHGWGRKEMPGPYRIDRICREFADIPPKAIREAIKSLQTDGLVEVKAAHRKVVLTGEAMRRIEASRRCFDRIHSEHPTTCIDVLCPNKPTDGV